MVAFKKQIKLLLNNIRNMLKSIPKSFIGLIFSMFVLLSPLLNDKMSFGHDYSFHATNTILTTDYIDISKLNFLLPKIFGGRIANGFGYGTGIFYPPLSYYLTSYISYFLDILNLNKSLAITCYEILVLAASGIIMYIFLKRIFKDNKIAGIGSISYISSTYFLCDIYTRSAIGEILTFIFIPIVFLGLYELFFGNDKKFIPLFTIGYIGMIYSHLVLSVYLTLIIIILLLCFPKKVFKKDKIIKLFISSILILLISSPYLVPLLEHKILGDYFVFTSSGMYTNEWIEVNTITLEEFYKDIPKPNNVKVYINNIVLLISIIVIIFNKKIFTKENKTIYKITLIILVISIFMSSEYFPWDKMPEFFKMIQFPWRLRGFTSFALSILVGNIVKLIKIKYNKVITIIIALSILIAGYNSIYQDNIYNPIKLDKKTFPYINGGGQNEYLPVNTKNNEFYYNNRNKDIIVKEGTAEITTIENDVPYLKSYIILDSNETTIELPRLYYLGYEIILIDKAGSKERINYYENEYGFIELKLQQSGILEVDYKGTLAHKIANYLCIGTIITILSLSTYKKIKKQIK